MDQQENPYRSPDELAGDDSQAFSELLLINRGRLIFIAIVLIGIAIEILLPLSISHDPDAFRIVLLLAIFFFAWRGHRWAIFLIGLLFGIGSIVSLFLSIRVIINRMDPVLLVLLTLAILYMAITLTIIYSKSLKAFLKHQATKRKANSDNSSADFIIGEIQSQTNDKELVTIATFGVPATAHMCRHLLENEGIKAFVVNDYVGGLNIPMFSLQTAKVQVAASDVEKALPLIKDFEIPSSNTKKEDEVCFKCEDCGREIKFSSHWRGRVRTCPYCGEFVDVPE